MDIHARPVLTYRWIVFLMAAGYSIYRIVVADYGSPGGDFRYLTIWALLFSFFSASRLLAVSEHRSSLRWDKTIMCTAVLNAMVVFMYWRLFFIDPTLVNGNGDIIWHQQYYLHMVGPAVQIFDALFIAQVFHRAHRAIPMLVAIILGYVAWTELFVQAFNNSPVGSVTSGLPYPFLNSMELSGRAVFYATNAATGIAVLGVFTVIMWVALRFIPSRR